MSFNLNQTIKTSENNSENSSFTEEFNNLVQVLTNSSKSDESVQTSSIVEKVVLEGTFLSDNLFEHQHLNNVLKNNIPQGKNLSYDLSNKTISELDFNECDLLNLSQNSNNNVNFEQEDTSFNLPSQMSNNPKYLDIPCEENNLLSNSSTNSELSCEQNKFLFNEDYNDEQRNPLLCSQYSNVSFPEFSLESQNIFKFNENYFDKNSVSTQTLNYYSEQGTQTNIQNIFLEKETQYEVSFLPKNNDSFLHFDKVKKIKKLKNKEARKHLFSLSYLLDSAKNSNSNPEKLWQRISTVFDELVNAIN